MSANDAGTSYRAVLLLPHALRLFLPAVTGRLAYGVLPLGMFFALAHASGSLGAAGLTAAASGLTAVLFGPSRSRLVDRFGRRVLPGLAVGYAACSTVLLLCAYAGAPLGVLLAMGALTGSWPPPLGPAMRAAWADIAPDAAVRLRAYSLDAVVEELLLTAGPLITGVAIAVADPLAAVAVGLALMIGGATVFGFGPATATAAPAGSDSRPGVRLLRVSRFTPLLVTLAGITCALGLVDIAVPVTAARAGDPAVAGYLLAGLSASSAVGGLLFGRRTWTAAWGVLLARLTVVLAALVAALALAPTLWLLAAGLAVTGLFLSPGLIMAYSLADELAPATARTEASTWVNTAGNAGVTIGTALSGLLADTMPRWLPYLIASLVLLATACLPGRALARRRSPAQDLTAAQETPAGVA
jgi:MFS family permease